MKGFLSYGAVCLPYLLLVTYIVAPSRSLFAMYFDIRHYGAQGRYPVRWLRTLYFYLSQGPGPRAGRRCTLVRIRGAYPHLKLLFTERMVTCKDPPGKISLNFIPPVQWHDSVAFGFIWTKSSVLRE